MSAENVKDIRMVPLPRLLEYNLKDTLGTWFVWNKNQPKMLERQQGELYEGLMKDTLKLLLHVVLTGMPISMKRVLEVEAILQEKADIHGQALDSSEIVQYASEQLTRIKSERDHAKRILKSKNPESIKYIERPTAFNAGSTQHKAYLLYNILQLPKIDFTDSGEPATGAKVLEKLINHTDNPAHVAIIENLIELAKVSKILNSFIPAFKQAQQLPDGSYRLFGDMNLGGTVSGRLSSSNPNLNNIPSGSTYGELVKSCFYGGKDWLFGSADFPALEERANTLLTRDPNKELPYLRGFDGHSFRTVRYWPELFTTLDIDDPVAVNAIEYTPAGKKQRKNSKPVTFAMQFFGTYLTLMKNCGFTQEQAKAIEANYLNMYKVSVEWVQNELDLAARRGYAIAAFGLRIDCPVMYAQKWRKGKRNRKEADAEARTLGNAISGQSYGLLNPRAAVEFMERVYASPYRYDILPCNLIHDAIYALMRNTLGTVKFFNDNLPDCMAWAELPELKHPEIGFPVMADIHYPSWANEIRMPTQASLDVLKHTFKGS